MALSYLLLKSLQHLSLNPQKAILMRRFLGIIYILYQLYYSG